MKLSSRTPVSGVPLDDFRLWGCGSKQCIHELHGGMRSLRSAMRPTPDNAFPGTIKANDERLIKLEDELEGSAAEMIGSLPPRFSWRRRWEPRAEDLGRKAFGGLFGDGRESRCGTAKRLKRVAVLPEHGMALTKAGFAQRLQRRTMARFNRCLQRFQRRPVARRNA
jgi:hypothetical protein